jgi:hypothetical protein
MDILWAREEAKSIIKHGGAIDPDFNIFVDDWYGDGDEVRGVAVVVILDGIFTCRIITNHELEVYFKQGNMTIFRTLSKLMVMMAQEIEEVENAIECAP